MKYIKYLILLLIIIFLTYLIILQKNKTLSTVNIKIATQNYSFEIARSILEKSQGLSHRSSLCQNCGMIFVFDQQDYYPFWMKDTKIPLDMIWLDQNNKIVTITTASPQDGQKTFINDKPAKYVIELNAGITQRLDLKIGDTINIPQKL